MAQTIVQVAVGVIKNKKAEILISKRADNVHQAGLWEFPGGKIEPGESAEQALSRELKEEVGIDCLSMLPFSTIEFDYGDKQVCLHVYIIEKFNGQATGREGQLISWVEIEALSEFPFPAANKSIIIQLQLPELIQITGGFHSLGDLLAKAKSCIKSGVKMIHFRAHHLADEIYQNYAEELLTLCKHKNVRLILNRDTQMIEKVQADGLHLTSHEMFNYRQRPCGREKYFSVSCHDQEQLEQAKALDVDYCFLSPVKQAISHNAGEPIGFDMFSRLCHEFDMKVYALGGMCSADIKKVGRLGGAGVAVISENWL